MKRETYDVCRQSALGWGQGDFSVRHARAEGTDAGRKTRGRSSKEGQDAAAVGLGLSRGAKVVGVQHVHLLAGVKLRGNTSPWRPQECWGPEA